MKKFLLALSLITLLAGCEEPVVNSTPGDPAVEKVFAPQMFYIADLGISEEGGYLLTQNIVTWLSESEGTCQTNGDVTDENSTIPMCNPNGFLIVKGDVRMQVVVPAETPVYVRNAANIMGLETAEEDGSYKTTLADLQTAMVENPEFFEVTPFQLSYGTVTVDGQEMSDQVSALNEIYIP